MSKQTYFYVVAGVFLVVAIMHLMRAINGWDLIAGEIEIPLWVSWVAVVVTGYLSFVSFNHGKRL